MNVSLALLVIGMDLVASGQSASAASAPGAIGSRVALVCTSCHGARVYADLRANRDDWRRYVYEMMLHGAQIRSTEEFDAIADYLTSAYGPVTEPSAVESARQNVPSAADQSDALLQRMCSSSCHALDVVTAVRRTPDDWNSVLTRMEARGARMTASQRQAIVAYLVEHFGRE